MRRTRLFYLRYRYPHALSVHVRRIDDDMHVGRRPMVQTSRAASIDGARTHSVVTEGVGRSAHHDTSLPATIVEDR